MLYAQLTNPNAGYPHDQEAIKQLDPEQQYQVERVSMGQSSTSVRLVGFSGGFNSVNLTFSKKNSEGVFVPHDIYRDPQYNPYI